MDRRPSRRRNGKKTGKRRGWIWTCGNNGATKAVADREVRGHGSDRPPPPLPAPHNHPAHLPRFLRLCHCVQGRGQLVEPPTEKTDAVLTRVRVPGAAKVGFFPPQSQLLVFSALRCPYSPRVQSLASTSVRTLKILNTGSHTFVWTHENSAHFDRNG